MQLLQSFPGRVAPGNHTRNTVGHHISQRTRRPSPFTVHIDLRHPLHCLSLSISFSLFLLHSPHMKIRRPVSEDVSSRIGSVRFQESNNHLIFFLLDLHMSLWMQTSPEDAALIINDLSSPPVCIGRCTFNWTYDIYTRQILRGPTHSEPESPRNAKAAECIIL